MMAWFVVVGSVAYVFWPVPDWLFAPFLTFIIAYPVILLAVIVAFRRRGKSASL
jgi:flagellar biosynthesis component FlhA